LKSVGQSSIGLSKAYGEMAAGAAMLLLQYCEARRSKLVLAVASMTASMSVLQAAVVLCSSLDCNPFSRLGKPSLTIIIPFSVSVMVIPFS
jgi:hypothetical protein